MRAVARDYREERLVDLKAFHTFGDIKTGLERRVVELNQFEPGTQLVIDIGNKSLSSKQVRELEDILLDHGLYLKEILSPGFINNLLNSEVFPPTVADMPAYEETVLICRHLRSGQRFFSPGNLVVLGDVNPGAEVIAVGNILIIGSLKGVAHAGYFGDESAVITAYRLNPTQLRIANHITRPPDGDHLAGKQPELARIRSEKVVIERLKI